MLERAEYEYLTCTQPFHLFIAIYSQPCPETTVYNNTTMATEEEEGRTILRICSTTLSPNIASH